MLRKLQFMIALILSFVVLVLSILVLVASRKNFVIAMGSDVLTTIYRVPLFWQIVGLFILNIGLSYTIGSYNSLFFLKLRSSLFMRLLIGGLSLFIFSMSVHMVSIDDKNINDVWGIWITRSLNFSYQEQRIEHIETNLFTMYCKNQRDEKITIFLGIYPWRLDHAAILRHPLITHHG